MLSDWLLVIFVKFEFFINPAAMISNESDSSDMEDGPHEELQALVEECNVVERVANIPLVSSAYTIVSSAYSSTKDSHPYIRSVCDVAELGAKTITGAAVTGTKPILTRLVPQIATANKLACKGLDRLESTLPILQQPADKVVSDAKSLVTGARDAVVGKVTNTVTGARDTVTGAVSGAMGLATGALQGSINASRSVVSSVVESQMGQFVASRADTMLGKTEKWVDDYLPMTDEELSQLAASLEGFDVAPPEEQRDQQSYYVRLGSLSSRIRHRAYRLSLDKLKNVQMSTTEVLSQLRLTFALVEAFNRHVEGGRDKLQQLWVDWSKQQTEAGSSDAIAGSSDDADGNEGGDQTFDSRILSMIRMMTKRLQTTCFTLVSSVQGLPANIQERMQRLRQIAQELHAPFASVRSLSDLTDVILAQSKAKVLKILGEVDEYIFSRIRNIPIPHLVGPFAPCICERPETPEHLRDY